MPRANYPTAHLHRYPWTELTAGQVQAALDANSGPASASALYGGLAGQRISLVLDDGPALAYDFTSGARLSVSENGGGAASAPYGALLLDHIVLVSHLVPGTPRGYHVVIDQDTGLATVFEVWFNGEVFVGAGATRQQLDINREVQRQIYYGYVDNGGAAPEGRHSPTNRVEGKGFHWTRDTGERSLELYSTVFNSHFVELTRTGGELGFVAPSDYVKINDDVYIYQRTECEFSGASTLAVMDVNTAKQAGVRLGFNEADALEYYLFTSTGEWVGQVAQFEAFGDTTAGTVMPAPADGSPLPKGARRTYRPARTYAKMTKEEVDAAIAASTRTFQPSAMAGNRTPPTDYLAGKSLTMRWDNGSNIEYRFQDATTLQWRREGGAWQTETYEASESMPHVILFAHLMTGAPDHDGQIIAADFEHGLATLIHGTIGTPYWNQEAAAKMVFGVIDEPGGVNPPIYRRHQFTDELVGRNLTWSYSPGLTSMHLYSTPNTVSWIIFAADGSAGASWAGPSQQAKIRDGIYFAYWLEEACNGTLGTILINMRTMHDCGYGMHAGEDGLSMSPVGAHARHAGRYDIAKYYQVRA